MVFSKKPKLYLVDVLYFQLRLLIVPETRTDYNSILESSYDNIIVIKICNTDNNFKYVYCDIPCNNRS